VPKAEGHDAANDGMASLELEGFKIDEPPIAPDRPHGELYTSIFARGAHPGREAAAGDMDAGCGGLENESKAAPLEPESEIDILIPSEAGIESSGTTNVLDPHAGVTRIELSRGWRPHASLHLTVLLLERLRLPADPGLDAARRCQQRPDYDEIRYPGVVLRMHGD
jgi:hypothetical protein